MGQIRTDITFHRLSADYELLEKRTQRSRSWTRHFFDLLYEPLGYSSNTLATVPDIFGTNRVLSLSSNSDTCNLMVSSPAGIAGSFFPIDGNHIFAAGASGTGGKYLLNSGDEWGIVVGSNNTAVTPADNALVAKILQGVVGGTLCHSGTEILFPVSVNPNCTMMIRRYFTNNSGGDVTIREVGIYSPGLDTPNVLAWLFCIARDVTADTVVHDTNILVVTYTVQITV